MGRDSTPDRFAGRYRVVRELGRGGFATVLEAWDEVAGHPVALKLVDRRALELAGGLHRFHREATVLQHLSHPNVVRAYGSGEHEGTPFLALELLRGVTVEVALRAGPMPLPRVVAMAHGLLGALAEAHRAGVVHRDVKPANVFLCPAGGAEVVKLLDFGVAKADGLDVAQTAMGATLGTAAYMAPEQVTGAVRVGPQADLFAVGLLIAEALCGQPVYLAGSGLSILVAKAAGRPVPMPAAVAASPLGEVVARAVQIDPSRRWESADAMRAAIDAAVATAGLAGVLAGSPGGASAADPLGATAPLAALRAAVAEATGSTADGTWRPPMEMRGDALGGPGRSPPGSAAVVMPGRRGSDPGAGLPGSARDVGTVARTAPSRTSFVPASARDDEVVEPVEPAAETVASPRLRRRRWMMAGVAVMAMAGLGVGAWAALSGDGRRGGIARGGDEPRIVVKNDGVIVITDGDDRTSIAPMAAQHPMLACGQLAGLGPAEVEQRLGTLGTVTGLGRGRVVSTWLVGRGSRMDPIVFYRIEVARRGKLPPEQLTSLIAERSRASGSVLVGGTHVLVGGGIAGDELQAAVCR